MAETASYEKEAAPEVTGLKKIRATFQEYFETFDVQKLRAAVMDQGLLLSKNDDDKDPPKGFEKFFRKRNERKSAEKKEDSKGKLLVYILNKVIYRRRKEGK